MSGFVLLVGFPGASRGPIVERLQFVLLPEPGEVLLRQGEREAPGGRGTIQPILRQRLPRTDAGGYRHKWIRVAFLRILGATR
ncbi:MAG: hypothetical protein ABSC05_03535 [Candidatus Solibacter sp.]|jgi:hypothetical protein